MRAICLYLLTVIVLQCDCYSRPSFTDEIKDLMDGVAIRNNWKWTPPRNYDECHIIPWQFMNQFTLTNYDYNRNLVVLRKFINDLSVPHVDAAYYQNMGSGGLRQRYNSVIVRYKHAATEALKANHPQAMLECFVQYTE